MMKVSSTRSFFRQAVGVCVELDTDAGTACAVPTSNLGPKLGFATMRDERRCVVLDDELSLGQAVIDTFAIARPWVA
jgi:hypothetical protein